MAENSFSKINYSQRDGAYECTKGEFKAVLNSCGIISRISCPHTAEQNDLVTQAYNNNEIDSCLQASLLKKVKDGCLLTAVYLINRLPSPVLHKKMPYELLYNGNNAQPQYNLLRVFGCQYFPYLVSYQRDKLIAKFIPCVFLGCGDNYKG